METLKMKVALLLALSIMSILGKAQDLGLKTYDSLIDKYEYNKSHKVSEKGLFTPANVDLILQYTYASSTRGFWMVIKNAKEIDKQSNKPFVAEAKISEILVREGQQGKVISSLNEPKWDSMYSSLQPKYGDIIADRTVCIVKAKYFRAHKDWEKFAMVFDKYVEKYIDVDLFEDVIVDAELNNSAWDIFQNSNDAKSLNLALNWLKPIVENPSGSARPQLTDTYANLLYKLGHKEDAIKWEEQAVAKIPQFVSALDKMKRGDRTW